MIMNRGKDICKELKAVRRQIAEENDIPLEISECTYQGPCKGTCPRCESEVRFLENALADRLRLGKVATVAGLALTLGVTGSAAAQSTEVEKVPPSHERQTGDCEVTGVVVDARTHEPLPFAQVMLYQDTAQAMVVQTDFDGRYRFSVHRGKYTLVVRGVVGYNEYRREVIVKRSSENQGTMELVYNPAQYDTYNTPRVDTIGLEIPMMGLVEVAYDMKGTIVDSKTKVELPFVNVIVLKDGKQVNGTVTDFDGNFQLSLEEGEYEFLISFVGYAQKRFPVKVPKDIALKAIELESTDVETLGIIIIEEGATPLIDPTTPGQDSEMKIEGVPLRIQY